MATLRLQPGRLRHGVTKCESTPGSKPTPQQKQNQPRAHRRRPAFNLGNRDDAALLAAAAARERMSDALLRSLFVYFGEDLPPSSNVAAAR